MDNNKETNELIQLMRELCSNSQMQKDSKYDKPELQSGGVKARQVIDNVYYRNKAKDGYLIVNAQGKKTVTDEYTGKKLAMPQYSDELHCPKVNVDHIIPLNKMREKYKDTNFLTTSDIKKAANISDNLALTAEHLNKSKGGNTNPEYITDHKDEINSNTAEKMLTAHKKAEKSTSSQINRSRVENAVGDFVNAAGNNILREAVPMCWSIISNIIDIATGKQTFEEGIREIEQTIAFVVKSSARAGACQLIVNTSENVAVASKYVVPIVGIYCIFSDDLLGLVKKEIDSEQCINNMAKKAIRVAGQCAAQKVAPKAGEAVVSLICKCIGKELSSAACTVITGGTSFVIELVVGYIIDYSIRYAEKEINASETVMNDLMIQYEASIKQCSYILIQTNIVSTTEFISKFLSAKNYESYIERGLKSCNAQEFLKGINGINALYGTNTHYSQNDFDKFCHFIRLGVDLQNV